MSRNPTTGRQASASRSGKRSANRSAGRMAPASRSAGRRICLAVVVCLVSAGACSRQLVRDPVGVDSGREPATEAAEPEGWSVEFPTVGVYSSPRVTDLDGDGVKDIIVGAGRFEFERVDTAVVALSGATGETLWIVPARDQVFGSPGLLDIDGDGTEDVIIGGRSAVLMAIEGRRGEVLWEFFPQGDSLRAGDHGWYNFYNPQIIPDQSGDGLEDILVSNGGDVRVPAHDPDRPPGKLMVIDSADGKLLAEAEVPDGKETYMSPVAAKIHTDDGDAAIIFGTGGETAGGHLYRTTLRDLMNGDISDALPLASDENKGFIAPPVLADINRDGYLDIVANAVDGRTLAVDGRTGGMLWEVRLDQVEGYASPAVGYFNEDEIPDFFTLFGVGEFPRLTRSIQVMIDGKTGEAEWIDTLGVAQTASPVIADIDGDGHDEAVLSVNFRQTDLEAGIIEGLYNMLVVYDFRTGSMVQLTGYLPGINLASTPWIGDLNGDSMLDIVFCRLTGDTMRGFRMIRLPTDIEITSEIKWGAYMGSRYDGIFR